MRHSALSCFPFSDRLARGFYNYSFIQKQPISVTRTTIYQRITAIVHIHHYSPSCQWLFSGIATVLCHHLRISSNNWPKSNTAFAEWNGLLMELLALPVAKMRARPCISGLHITLKDKIVHTSGMYNSLCPYLWNRVHVYVYVYYLKVVHMNTVLNYSLVHSIELDLNILLSSHVYWTPVLISWI